MHVGEDLLVLGILFVIAYVLGRLGKLIGLPAIPIYMLVGLFASPYSHFFPLNFAAADVQLVAVFGLILLLFSLGLEFDQDEFYGNAGALLVSGGTRIVINMAVGFALGMWVGWGTREALIIAGMTATSSSAIVTKLLIELRRLANRETPAILGIMVLEDVFIAIYLAIVGVIVGGRTDLWGIVFQLGISFTFLIVMFVIARWGGRIVSRLVQTKDDELFTILFFGLAVAFGGIGELLGVSNAIGAFLIGLVLGATRFRGRIEQFALPLRDVFGAFFFLSFGLALNVTTFGEVLFPVAVAVVVTLVVNTAGGQLIAWQNKLTRAEGFNASAMLQNRGEFALILATLAVGAGLDARLTPFAGLYVLVMAIVGPVLAVNSERMGAVIFRSRATSPTRERNRSRAEGIALVEAAAAGQLAGEVGADTFDPRSDDFDGRIDPRSAERDGRERELDPIAALDDIDRHDIDRLDIDRLSQQASQQSDELADRKRDPEY